MGCMDESVETPPPTRGRCVTLLTWASDPAHVEVLACFFFFLLLMPPPRGCIRCRHDECVLAVREAWYCARCYARVFDEKMRASLDHTRGAILLQSVVRTAEAVPPAYAIVCDGSAASYVLVHAMYRLLYVPQAHPSPARAPERARLDVLYLDEDGHADDVRAQIARVAPDAVFVLCTLSDAFQRGQGVVCTRQPPWTMGEVTEAPATAAHDLLSATLLRRGTPSAGATRAEDMHRILCQRVLHDTARARQCAALLFPQDATQTAAYILDALAKGAGHKLPVEGAASLWVQDVLHLHPLRAFLPHECAFYARVHGIATRDETPAAADMTYESISDKSSMGHLAESLITALQHGVSSTSSTVIGTASKLVLQDTPKLWPTVPADAYPGIGAKGAVLVRTVQALPHWDWDEMRACPLCRFPAQEGAAQWTSERSIRHAAPPTCALDAHLCYACLQVLDIPHGTRLVLPPGVHDLVRRPERPAASVRVVAPALTDHSMRDALAEPHVPRPSHAPTRVAPDAMREQVASFLL